MTAARKKQTARNRPITLQGLGARKPAANPTMMTTSAVRARPLSLQPRMTIEFPVQARCTPPPAPHELAVPSRHRDQRLADGDEPGSQHVAEDRDPPT